MEKIYNFNYDNYLNSDGTEKENTLLGEFEILEGDTGGYSYKAYGRGIDGEIYKIIGQEISYLGTRNKIYKLSETEDIQVYNKYIKGKD